MAKSTKLKDVGPYAELYLTQDDGSSKKFSVGDKVVILMLNHNQRIGVITEIRVDYFRIRPIDKYFTPIFDIETVSLSDVKKMRKASIFDDEEREFWMTHYVSRDGIMERTPEDIAAMRRYFGEENK